MNDESLITAIEVIINALEKSNIDIIDKVELMINLKEFLNYKKYETNIKTLKYKRRNDYDN